MDWQLPAGSLFIHPADSMRRQAIYIHYPAGCACLCENWYPSTWPCGGLYEQYEITDNLISPYDGSTIMSRQTSDFSYWQEVRLWGGSAIVNADGFNQCQWTVSGPNLYETRAPDDYLFPNWTLYTGGGGLVLKFLPDECRWQIVDLNNNDVYLSTPLPTGQWTSNGLYIPTQNIPYYLYDWNVSEVI